MDTQAWIGSEPFDPDRLARPPDRWVWKLALDACELDR